MPCWRPSSSIVRGHKLHACIRADLNPYIDPAEAYDPATEIQRAPASDNDRAQSVGLGRSQTMASCRFSLNLPLASPAIIALGKPSGAARTLLAILKHAYEQAGCARYILRSYPEAAWSYVTDALRLVAKSAFAV